MSESRREDPGLGRHAGGLRGEGAKGVIGFSGRHEEASGDVDDGSLEEGRLGELKGRGRKKVS